MTWAGFVLISPYAPFQFDPVPPRVSAFNSFANATHVLSFSGIRSSAIRCANALDQDLAFWIQRQTLRLLPMHALGTTACAAFALVVCSLSWPRWARILSTTVLAVLAVSWGAILLSNISRSRSFDIPLLVLAWASVSLGPMCVLILVSSGIRALSAPRSEAPGA